MPINNLGQANLDQSKPKFSYSLLNVFFGENGSSMKVKDKANLKLEDNTNQNKDFIHSLTSIAQYPL